MIAALVVGFGFMSVIGSVMTIEMVRVERATKAQRRPHLRVVR